ncbi:drosomycin-like [Vespula squamosa]|uniref:Drosomycin-like n=1 Tax=Vespula squamosa TaxID=30214 RepID=A0ABD2APB3_VESSQ
MAKIYFLAFLALLVFVAVSAQEEQDKGPALDMQFENAEEYSSPCVTGGNNLCNRYCRSKGHRFGSCTRAKKCLCYV